MSCTRPVRLLQPSGKARPSMEIEGDFQSHHDLVQHPTKAGDRGCWKRRFWWSRRLSVMKSLHSTDLLNLKDILLDEYARISWSRYVMERLCMHLSRVWLPSRAQQNLPLMNGCNFLCIRSEAHLCIRRPERNGVGPSSLGVNQCYDCITCIRIRVACGV